MKITDLTVEVRNANFERVGLVAASELPGFEAVLRFNNVGTWKFSLPADHPLAPAVRELGSGIIVTGPNGVILSGPMTAVTVDKGSDDPIGMITVEGTDDSVVLGQRLAYPTPTTADVTAQTQAYDKRTGFASTVMRQYINANIGPSAPVARRISNMTLAPDPVVGSTVYGSARFDILGELLTGLAAVDGLGFDIKQQGPDLEFKVYQPADKSGFIRMDIANDTLSSTKFSYSAPSATVAIVAGEGTEDERIFQQVTTTASTEAEDAWGRRIEAFLDQRNSADSNELTQAGLEKLAEDGSTQISLEVVPSSDLTMEYGVDWDLGDRVTVVVDGEELTSTVTAVALKIESNGLFVGATVGNPEGVDYESRLNKRQSSTSQKVNSLERSETIPTNAAGGDLSGNYPNPVLANIGTAGNYDRITTDGKGRVIAGTTSRRLYLTKNGNLNTTTGTTTDVTGWTTVENVGGFTLASNVVTVANAGIYNLTLAVTFAANSTGQRSLGVVLSGGRNFRVISPSNAANAQVTTVVCSLNSINIAAGETITLTARQESGGTLAINTDTYFSIQSA